MGHEIYAGSIFGQLAIGSLLMLVGAIISVWITWNVVRRRKHG